jgi:hypothetical protein
MPKSMKPGGGGRFQALTKHLTGQGYTADSAKAIAAAAGRKKYGAHKMATWAEAGKKRAAK